MRHPLSHASTPIEPQESAGAAAREEWPTNVPPPPPPPMPEQPPVSFSIARPARLLGIAWAVSVPAVLWSHVKFSNPVAVVVVAGGILLGLGLATALAWALFMSLKRSRNAAAVTFGGLACAGLAVNVLVGVFMSLAAGALREIDQGPGTVKAQIRQELAIAKKVAAEEIGKAHEEGVKGLLKDRPSGGPAGEAAPVAPGLVLGPTGDGAATPQDTPPTGATPGQGAEHAAEVHAGGATGAAAGATQPPSVDTTPVAPTAPGAAAASAPQAAPRAVGVKPASKPVAKPVVKPQVNVPQRGISVRKPGSKMPEPVVATIDDATIDRVAYDAAVAVQERVDKASRRYADSALRLSTLRDPLLYHSQAEFREFRRALDQHRTDAEALRDAVVTASGQMQSRLSQAGVPAAQADRHVAMAFPREITDASAEFHNAYLVWLDAREHRAMVLETALGRWKYNADTRQLWLADDGVRSACESAFDSVRASATMLTAKREVAEELGIPTKASEMRAQSGRFANEPEAN
ncbi:MAG: hypothetical protein U0637_10150 [Phycisphaerales bacterium]